MWEVSGFFSAGVAKRFGGSNDREENRCVWKLNARIVTTESRLTPLRCSAASARQPRPALLARTPSSADGRKVRSAENESRQTPILSLTAWCPKSSDAQSKFLSLKQAHDLGKPPNVVGQARLHCRSDTQCLVDSCKVDVLQRPRRPREPPTHQTPPAGRSETQSFFNAHTSATTQPTNVQPNNTFSVQIAAKFLCFLAT